MKTTTKKNKHYGTVNDELVTKREVRNFMSLYSQEIFALVSLYLPEKCKEELTELCEGFEDYEVDNLEECTSKQMIEYLSEKNSTYTDEIAKYLDKDIEDKICDIECEGYKVFKFDSLAEDIKFENFMDELKANPYQLNLV